MRCFKFVHLKNLIVRVSAGFGMLILFSIILIRNINEPGMYILLLMWCISCICLILSITTNNLYCRYRITEEGVENGYIKIKWSDAFECKAIFEEDAERHLYKEVYPPMILIGKIRDGGVFRQNRKECVIIPITQVNLQLIHKCCTVENEDIKELLNQFLNYPEYNRKLWWL